MKQILSLVNKHFGKEFDSSDYEKIDLFPKGNLDFENFLVMQRVWKFQKLLVLSKLAFQNKFFAGNEVTRLAFYDEDNPRDDIEYGITVVDAEFLGDWLFYYFVKSLSVAQIIIPYAYSPYEHKHFNKEGEVKFGELWPGENCGPSFQDEFFVSDGLIIRSDCIYAKPELAAKIRELLSKFNNTFKDFVDKNKNACTVSHYEYIEWLLSWFPGLINVRSLE
ncbi:hypothetical protein KY329_01650 [Candidatus Woesearchaeota archaeon]|nr:hypothetical protein [Candidatus Woesearchaeota archaeon]